MPANPPPTGIAPRAPIWPGLGHEITFDGGLRLLLPRRCPRGHDISDRGSFHAGFSHAWYGHVLTCRACTHAGRDPATWALVDPLYDVREDGHARTRGTGLHLVVHRPTSPTGVGRIAALADQLPAAEVRFALCVRCRAGLLVHLRVEPRWRRTGFGRTLLACALVRGPGWRWTTTIRPADEVVQQFAQAYGRRVSAGPGCRHMATEAGH